MKHSRNRFIQQVVMRTLISSAIHYLDREQDPELPEDAGQSIACDGNNTMLLTHGGEPEQKPEILIVGCGGTGNAVINRLFHRGFSGPQTMVVDHDSQTFLHSHAALPFLLKRAYFRDTDCVLEGHPDIVAKASRNAGSDLETRMGNPDLCIIVAGLGGNAGTGSAPEIARIAKSLGSAVTAFLTLPSRLEKSRTLRARKALEELLQVVDSVFVLDLNNLLRILPKDLPFIYVYSTADQIFAEVIRNLYERVCIPSLINLDREDLFQLLTNGGFGTIFFGETRESNFVEGLMRDCQETMMKDIPVPDIASCIILIEGYYAGLYYSEQIATGLTCDLDPHADIIWGANEDHSIPEGEVRVFALLSTGKKIVV